MTITAKVVQIILGIIAILAMLNSLFAKTLIEFSVTLSLSITLMIFAYLLHKYISKNSTTIELKNYRLRIFQIILSFLGLMQLFNCIYSASKLSSLIIDAIWIAIVLFGIVAIEKRILKTK